MSKISRDRLAYAVISIYSSSKHLLCTSECPLSWTWRPRTQSVLVKGGLLPLQGVVPWEGSREEANDEFCGSVPVLQNTKQQGSYPGLRARRRFWSLLEQVGQSITHCSPLGGMGNDRALGTPLYPEPLLPPLGAVVACLLHIAVFVIAVLYR